MQAVKATIGFTSAMETEVWTQATVPRIVVRGACLLELMTDVTGQRRWNIEPREPTSRWRRLVWTAWESNHAVQIRAITRDSVFLHGEVTPTCDETCLLQGAGLLAGARAEWWPRKVLPAA